MCGHPIPRCLILSTQRDLYLLRSGPEGRSSCSAKKSFWLGQFYHFSRIEQGNTFLERGGRITNRDKKPCRSRGTGEMRTYAVASCADGGVYALPMRNILVPQTGQVPWVAGRPFFMVMALGFFTSLFLRHFTQYACMVCLLESNLQIG